MGDAQLPVAGFVGAGQMGGPMVERLLAAGRPVSLFARRDEVRAYFAALGAAVTPSVAEVAASAPVVIVCLFDEGQLLDVALGAGGLVASLRPGSVLVNHTTVGMAATRSLAAACAEAGSALVDAPVSGTADDIRAGRLTVLAGGPPAAVAAARPLVEAYAGTVVATGDAGSATAVKLVNNAVFAANLRVALDATRVAGDLGVDTGLAAAALGQCSGASYAMSMVEALGPDVVAQGAEPYLVKDVGAVRRAAADAGIDLGLVGEAAADGRLTTS